MSTPWKRNSPQAKRKEKNREVPALTWQEQTKTRREMRKEASGATVKPNGRVATPDEKRGTQSRKRVQRAAQRIKKGEEKSITDVMSRGRVGGPLSLSRSAASRERQFEG